jgi:hypothetical protein
VAVGVGAGVGFGGGVGGSVGAGVETGLVLLLGVGVEAGLGLLLGVGIEATDGAPSLAALPLLRNEASPPVLSVVATASLVTVPNRAVWEVLR